MTRSTPTFCLVAVSVALATVLALPALAVSPTVPVDSATLADAPTCPAEDLSAPAPEAMQELSDCEIACLQQQIRCVLGCPFGDKACQDACRAIACECP